MSAKAPGRKLISSPPLAEGVCPSPGICQSGSAAGALTNPLYAYNHAGSSSSITSVLAYDGRAFGGAGNLVFFADFNKGWIQVLDCTAGYASCGSASIFDAQAGQTTRLIQGPDGNIYQLTLDGKISRIAPAGGAGLV
jgi:aldose sugar dehydrogenase